MEVEALASTCPSGLHSTSLRPGKPRPPSAFCLLTSGFWLLLLYAERCHRERAGAIRIHRHRRSALAFTHEGLQARDERRDQSGAGSARVSSDSWTMRPGVGSMESVTASMPAGCGVRFEIEQQQRAQHFGSRIGAGSCRLRRCRSRVTSRRRRCKDAARSRCSRRWHNGSSSRARTNESGSRVRDGPSRFERRLEGLFFECGHERPRTSSPRARRCQRMPSCPSRSERSTAGSAASSPSVRRPRTAVAARAGD